MGLLFLIRVPIFRLVDPEDGGTKPLQNASNCHSTRRCIPEDMNVYLHHCESLMSRSFVTLDTPTTELRQVLDII